LDFEGETVYIDETGDQFDLWAIDEAGVKTFFEVKSHARAVATKIPVNLSGKQFDFFATTAGRDRVELVVVENVVSDSPHALFFRVVDVA
jgi:hypothetical protein